MSVKNGVFKLTEIGLDCMYTDKFWEMSRLQQCALLILYACFLSEQDNFGLESIFNMIGKKNLLEKSDEEFKKLCDELKDNKEACKDFLNIEFN